MSRRTRWKTGIRAGFVLAAVLVSLLVVMMLAAALTKTLVLHRQEIRSSEQRQQSFWLAESALQRARHALSRSSDYRGETWHVAADVLGGGRAGVAVIRVESVDEPAAGLRVRVEASYPEDSIQRILHERELILNLSE
jgi:Tfp pilus assembly protein PilV